MAAEASTSQPPKREGRRFAILIALGLAFAVLQTWFMPSGRAPSLARTTAENAYAMARETPQQMTFGQLNDGKWQTARLYLPGEDLLAACNALSEGQADCRTALAKPPKEIILFGLQNGKLARIEQMPASFVQLQDCHRTLHAAQTVRLYRSANSTVAQLDCQIPAP